MASTRSTIEIGKMNEALVMHALLRYGGLRSTDLARLLWPRMTQKNGKRMALKVCKRLVAKRLCVVRTNLWYQPVYVLAQRGAEYLNNRGIGAKHGLALSGMSDQGAYHRTLCNLLLIECERRGSEIFSEVVLLQDLGPFTKQDLLMHYDRMPDGLVLNKEPSTHQMYVDWIEVENSYKKAEERQRIIAIADKVGTPMCSDPGYILSKIVIVAPKTGPIASGFKRSFIQYVEGRTQDQKASLADAFCFVTIQTSGCMGFVSLEVHDFADMLRIDDD